VFQKIKFKDFHPQIQGLSRPGKSEKKFKEFQGPARALVLALWIFTTEGDKFKN